MTTANEEERLLELYHYDLLDTVNEKEFDDIVQLASRLCNVPISTITLVDQYRQWFKARVGMPDSETSRELSFCAHAIAGDHELMEVEDATKDDRFHDYPNVTGDPNIRFYAGVPLVTKKGYKLGTLCVIDNKPRQLTEEQSYALKVLGHQVVKLAEQRLQNRYLHNYQKRLEQQSEMQNRILAIVAHDVRSPLVSLQGIIELSEENIISEEKKSDMIGMWKKQLDNTMQLLTNLIDWGKIQAGNDVLNNAPVNLHDIVQDEFEKCVASSAMKGNTLRNEVDEKFLAYGDENVLRFILRNAVSNANKFTGNGTITISASRKKNKIFLSVADTGIGMSEAQLKSLREGKPAMVGLGTRNEKGSGLGFILITEFVEMMDGSISIDSAPRKGTILNIELWPDFLQLFCTGFGRFKHANSDQNTACRPFTLHDS
jgi:signal transduction histidine kinase